MNIFVGNHYVLGIFIDRLRLSFFKKGIILILQIQKVRLQMVEKLELEYLERIFLQHHSASRYTMQPPSS